jgi:RNA ligase
MAVEFRPWPKIPRLNREITITEKIDGTNACIIVLPYNEDEHYDQFYQKRELLGLVATGPTTVAVVGAQSRTRLIQPGKTTDNYGFAQWVQDNAVALVETLGLGYHYGEWWGQGIQRNYGQTEKHFSLFNHHRWGYEDLSAVPNLDTVPLLYKGRYHGESVDLVLDLLREIGSVAKPGWMKPEGVVVWHSQSKQYYKVLLKGDDVPKGDR